MERFFENVLSIAHVGNHANVSTLNPTARNLPPPSRGGLPIGVDEHGHPVMLNQLELHALGLTGGTSGLILAERGSGKTATLKKLALLESYLANAMTGTRRRIVVDDTRLNVDAGGRFISEYRTMVEALGGRHIDLSGYKINILDHRMGMSVDQQFELVLSLCEVISGRQLTPTEQAALLIAVFEMNQKEPEAASILRLEQLLARFDRIDYERFQSLQLDKLVSMIDDQPMAYRVRSDMEARDVTASLPLKSAATVVSHMLLRLHNGYGGVFGAEHSLFDILTQPVVGLDFTRLNEDVIPLLEMVIWSWRGGAITRSGEHIDIAADYEIHDENWSRWSSLTYARNMVRHLKHIRGRGTRIWRAMHRISDIEQVGPAGSEQRAKAMTGLKETDIVLIGKTARSEHQQLQETFGAIAPRYLSMLPTLGAGQFLVKIGEAWTPFMLNVRLTPLERQIAESDVARDVMLGGGAS